MEPAAFLASALPELGVLAAAACAAMALVARDDRCRSEAMVAALVLAAVVLVGHIHDTEQFRDISGSPSRLLAAIVIGTGAIVALATLFTRSSHAFALIAIAVLPFRVPVAAAGTTANLLVPLYFVIAGGCAASLWARMHRSGEVQRRERSGLEIALAAFIVVYTLQALYSRDFDVALEQVVFFLVPFAVLFRLLTQVTWTRTLIVRCLAVLVVEALVFSAIGFWEYDRRELFWNPKVIASNQFDSFFRVNSVFWDPNIYGRFLVLTMLGLVALMLWSGRTRVAIGTAAALAVLWGGLVLTFSQSSFVALLAGLAVLAALRWNVRKTLLAAGAALATGLVFVLAFQGALNIELGSSAGVDKVTSGRGTLISGGLSLFGDRPVWGYGSGAFGRAYRQEQHGNQQQSVSASHTLPVTVAAEQGLIGLAAYALVMICALFALLGNDRHRSAVSERGPPQPSAERSDADAAEPVVLLPARAAIAAAFVALLVHTMAYAAFLEDPFAWVLMAAGLSLAALAGQKNREAEPSLHKPVIPLAE
ncbi:MAG: O-antigen ligase family protein [Solirubrobacterales bacterium]